jgi:hypothetical protein
MRYAPWEALDAESQAEYGSKDAWQKAMNQMEQEWLNPSGNSRGPSKRGGRKPIRINDGIGQVQNGTIQMTENEAIADGPAPLMFNTNTGSITQASGRGGLGGGAWNVGDEGYQQLMDNYQQNNPQGASLAYGTTTADILGIDTDKQSYPTQPAPPQAPSNPLQNEASPPAADILGIEQPEASLQPSPIMGQPATVGQSAPTQSVQYQPQPYQQAAPQPALANALQTRQGLGVFQGVSSAYDNVPQGQNNTLQDRQQSANFNTNDTPSNYHTGLNQLADNNTGYAGQAMPNSSVFSGLEAGGLAWWLR